MCPNVPHPIKKQTAIDKLNVWLVTNQSGVINSKGINILTKISNNDKIMENLFGAFKKIIKKYKNFAREKLIKFSENQNEF
jgi:hypothetical protein